MCSSDLEAERLTISEEKVREENRQAVVYEMIGKLESKLQTTLILYYYNDLSVKEIAKVMGCLEGTVKSRLHTGRKKVKQFLEKEYKEDRTGEVEHA